MRNIVNISLLIISLMVLVSCEKTPTTVNPSVTGSGEQEKINIDNLKGEWNFESYAYTIDGSEIINQQEINRGYINVTDTGYIWLFHTNKACFEYAISNSNKINVVFHWTTLVGTDSNEEEEICNVFKDIKSYEIKDNKLFLHYAEKDNKNVLVLNKR